MRELLPMTAAVPAGEICLMRAAASSLSTSRRRSYSWRPLSWLLENPRRSYMMTVNRSFKHWAKPRQGSQEPLAPEMQSSGGPSPTTSWYMLAPGVSRYDMVELLSRLQWSYGFLDLGNGQASQSLLCVHDNDRKGATGEFNNTSH